MPAGDQIDCYLSCNVRINKGELKKKTKKHANIKTLRLKLEVLHPGIHANGLNMWLAGRYKRDYDADTYTRGNGIQPFWV